MRTNSLYRLIAVCGLASAAGCGGSDPQENAQKDAMEGMPGTGSASEPTSVVLTAEQIKHGGIAWEPVTLGPIGGAVMVPGALMPNEDRTARVDAPVQGRVIAVRVRPGDRVTAGQVLVTLHSPEAGMAQSDVAKAEAEVASQRAQAAYARSARDRAERLLALKAIPRQDYERAIADDELARAALAQAEAELRRAVSTAEQLGARSGSGEVELRSPLTGVVLSRNAVPGGVVEAGAPLVAVTDASALWLTVNAPEQFAPLLQVGGRLSFKVPAYPDQEFTARIESVGSGLDPGTRTLPVRAAVNNRDRKLRPEMLASVTIEGVATATAVLLPADAIQNMKGKTVAFIAAPDGKGGARITVREVTAGARTNGRVAVANGLQAGELVVTRGAFNVKAQIEKAAMPKMEM